jgi:flagellar biosynthetic protein FliP
VVRAGHLRPTHVTRGRGRSRGRRLALVLLALVAFLGVLTLAPTAAAPAVAAAPAAAAPAPTPGPAAPATPKTPRTPGGGSTDDPIGDITRDIAGDGGSPFTVVLLLGLMSIVPALMMTMTAFTRIVIVLGFTRSGLGTPGVPPNQVIIGLALFLSLFVMGPTFAQANEQALQPLLKDKIEAGEAFDRAEVPFKKFMLAQVREKELGLMVRLSGKPAPKKAIDVPMPTLVPAFVLSELRTAFLIGFVIFIPFLVIDLVVAAALSSLGMMMLPPVLISLPFKLLLFVAADGWYLVVESLVTSFNRADL